MPTLQEIKEQYPQYKDVPDADLLTAMHKNFYSSTPPTELAKALNAPLVWNAETSKFEDAGAGQKRRLKTFEDVGRTLANGATFGWADEASAKMDELTGNGTYSDNLAREQARSWAELRLRKIDATSLGSTGVPMAEEGRYGKSVP